jgi:hypothetical protein
VSSISVVVVDIVEEKIMQMPSVHDDHVIQHLSTEIPDLLGKYRETLRNLGGLAEPEPSFPSVSAAASTEFPAIRNREIVPTSRESAGIRRGH